MIPVKTIIEKPNYIEFPENELINLALKIDYHNNLLYNIKTTLDNIGKTKEYEQLSSIKLLIVRNLEQYESHEDIQLIKESFREKISCKYPILTANDIKLAALIRLNYSTKKVADILNINSRSVEQKRCRLRKKMNLRTDQNLLNLLQSL